MTERGICCTTVTKAFRGGGGVHEVTLAVPPATAYALIGANGAGKTTLMNVCLGFLAPDSGTVLIDGMNVQRDPLFARRRLAYLPEVARLYPHLTALQNMAMFEGLMRREHSDDVYHEALRHLDFSLKATSDRVSTYSKGMRQKLAIAIGLLKGASVFLLDEPTSGLDPRSAMEFNRMIETLRDDGKAILFASHDLFSVRDCADRIGVLKDGHLLCEKMSREFKHLESRDLYDSLSL